jgi:hypothetical protein
VVVQDRPLPVPIRRLTSILSLLALAAAVPASADAAVSFDRPCYQDTYASATAAVTADGLPGDAVVHVAVDGQEQLVARADASGRVSATIPVPAHVGPDEESEHAVTLTTDDGHSTSGTLYASSLTAGFAPTRGDARTLKVRFSVFGMNLLEPSSVYVHYVSPNGKLHSTIALGAAQGPCGHIENGKKRRLFPFSPKTGRWTLQFDSRRRYARGTDTSPYPWATVGVRVAAPAR